jgi:hypothetical protein
MAKKRKDENGLLIPAGIMIGLGIGFMTGNIPAWLFIGLGSGFVGMFLGTKLSKK